MENIFNKNILLIVSLMLVINSCVQENDFNSIHNSDCLTIQQAKEWYEAQYQANNDIAMSRAQGDSTQTELIPLLNWFDAELDNDSLWSVVELPWEYANGEVKKTDGEGVQATLSIVILKNRKTGDTYGFKMAIYEDSNGKNNYLHRDENLSGKVLFYTMEDNRFVNGWYYKDGKIIGLLKVEDENNQRDNVAAYVNKPMKLTESEVIIIEITCYYSYSTCAGCDIHYDVQCVVKSFVVFEQSDDGGGGGGTGSGGYDTSAGSSTESSDSQDDGDLPDKKPTDEDIINECNDILNTLKDAIGTNFSELSNYGGYDFNNGTHLPSYADFLNAISANPNVEHSMTFKYDEGSGYFTSGINSGTANRSYNVVNDISVSLIHNHLDNTPPSPKDLQVILDFAYYYSSFNYLYTLTQNGTIYALEVTDRDALINFYNQYYNSMIIDNNNMFADETDFRRNWEQALTNFEYLDTNTAWEYALAYVMEKYNMGVTISRKEGDGFSIGYLKMNETTGKYELIKCQ